MQRAKEIWSRLVVCSRVKGVVLASLTHLGFSMFANFEWSLFFSVGDSQSGSAGSGPEAYTVDASAVAVG